MISDWIRWLHDQSDIRGCSQRDLHWHYQRRWIECRSVLLILIHYIVRFPYYPWPTVLTDNMDILTQ
jgi:hypothetical protein